MRTPKQFWSNFHKYKCWIWKGGGTKSGYGQVRWEGVVEYVHRVAFILAKGPIPDGFDVHHTCGIRRCGNPEHLELMEHSYHGVQHAS